MSAENRQPEGCAATYRYAVETTVYVTVTIRNPEVVERVTGPNGDEWRSQFYDMHEAEEVIEHFSLNAISNGVHDITRLEGWADCDKDDVLIEVDDISHWTTRV